jgi:hypothetical protein
VAHPLPSKISAPQNVVTREIRGKDLGKRHGSKLLAKSHKISGPLGIHVHTMENHRTFARLLSHILPFLPIAHGKASGCCRARRGSRRQTRKEVRNQSVSSVRIASLKYALPKHAQLLR